MDTKPTPDAITLEKLRVMLAVRFGDGVAETVLRLLGLEAAGGPFEPETVSRALAAADDLQAVHAGQAFPLIYPVSAMGSGKLFRAICATLGISVQNLSEVDRLHIDALFARQWQLQFGRRPVSEDLEQAASLMKNVLFALPGIGLRAD